MSILAFLIFVLSGALVSMIVHVIFLRSYPYMSKAKHMGLILGPYVLFCIILLTFL